MFYIVILRFRLHFKSHAQLPSTHGRLKSRSLDKNLTSTVLYLERGLLGAIPETFTEVDVVEDEQSTLLSSKEYVQTLFVLGESRPRSRMISVHDIKCD